MTCVTALTRRTGGLEFLEALRLGDRVHVMTGRPAALEPVPLPDLAPPRDVRDPAVLAAQGALLARLAA